MSNTKTVGASPKITWVNQRVSIIGQREHKRDNRKLMSAARDYEKLQEWAENYTRSHRLEESVAGLLRTIGIQANALPAKAHGRHESAADILITLDDGYKITLEVKETRSKKITLGNPVLQGSHLEGYKRYPSSVIVDAAWSWDNKCAAAEENQEHLLGALILVPIGRLSNQYHTTLGLVYCPSSFSNEWFEDTSRNYGKTYTSLRCPEDCMGTLADLKADVERLKTNVTGRLTFED